MNDSSSKNIQSNINKNNKYIPTPSVYNFLEYVWYINEIIEANENFINQNKIITLIFIDKEKEDRDNIKNNIKDIQDQLFSTSEDDNTNLLSPYQPSSSESFIFKILQLTSSTIESTTPSSLDTQESSLSPDAILSSILQSSNSSDPQILINILKTTQNDINNEKNDYMNISIPIIFFQKIDDNKKFYIYKDFNIFHNGIKTNLRKCCNLIKEIQYQTFKDLDNVINRSIIEFKKDELDSIRDKGKNNFKL